MRTGTEAFRKMVGNFFSRMLHFAFTGKFDVGTDKPAQSFSKCKAYAMNQLYESILKAVLPSFSTISSDQSMVEKRQKFLGESGPSSSASAAPSKKKSQVSTTFAFWITLFYFWPENQAQLSWYFSILVKWSNEWWKQPQWGWWISCGWREKCQGFCLLLPRGARPSCVQQNRGVWTKIGRAIESNQKDTRYSIQVGFFVFLCTRCFWKTRGKGGFRGGSWHSHFMQLSWSCLLQISPARENSDWDAGRLVAGGYKAMN